MSYPVYYPEAGDTLPHLFDTFDGGTGASITMTGLATTDIEIYQDGVATTRASDNGYALLDTDGIDFDSKTGIHGFSIDLSDNSDDGFYAVGSWYHVVISTITVDAQTVSFVAYSFRIVSATRGMAGTALPDAAADAAGGVPISDGGGLDIDATDSNITAILADTLVIGYAGPRGFGVYLNDAAGNVNTVNGVDGLIGNPVSTIAAAKTLADSMSLDRIYLVNDSAITLAATMVDYEFIGIGAPGVNSIALDSQDVSNCAFYNLTITGVQGGSGRALYEDCIFGVCTLHLLGRRCGLIDSASTGVTFSNNDDNIMDSCYSMVPGNIAPVLTCSAANLDLSMRHYSGGLNIKNSHATATISIETDGQVIFDATCNSNTDVTMRGCLSITDNASMTSLTTDAVLNQERILAAVTDDDTKIDGSSVNAVEAKVDTIDGNVDTILVDTGTTLPGLLPAALISGRMSADMQGISGSTDSAVNLDASAEVIVPAIVDTVTNGHTPTTTEFQSDTITEATAEHYNGRVVIFRSGALTRQATDITAYALVGGIGQFTVTAMTEAPANNDTFVIV